MAALPHLPAFGTPSARLRWARERAQLPMAELARRAGLSHNAISRLERSPDADPEAKTAFKLAALLAAPGEDVASFAQWLVCGHADPAALELGRRQRRGPAGA